MKKLIVLGFAKHLLDPEFKTTISFIKNVYEEKFNFPVKVEDTGETVKCAGEYKLLKFPNNKTFSSEFFDIKAALLVLFMALTFNMSAQVDVQPTTIDTVNLFYGDDFRNFQSLVLYEFGEIETDSFYVESAQYINVEGTPVIVETSMNRIKVTYADKMSKQLTTFEIGIGDKGITRIKYEDDKYSQEDTALVYDTTSHENYILKWNYDGISLTADGFMFVITNKIK
jgi:hypothetical protein